MSSRAATSFNGLAFASRLRMRAGRASSPASISHRRVSEIWIMHAAAEFKLKVVPHRRLRHDERGMIEMRGDRKGVEAASSISFSISAGW